MLFHSSIILIIIIIFDLHRNKLTRKLKQSIPQLFRHLTRIYFRNRKGVKQPHNFNQVQYLKVYKIDSRDKSNRKYLSEDPIFIKGTFSFLK